MKKRDKIILELAKVDAILITDLNNLRYFTNFKGTSGYAIISSSKNYFLTDNRYKIEAEKDVPSNFTIIICNKKVLDELINILSKLKIEKLGLESDTVPYDFVQNLKGRLGKVKIINVSDYILTMRSIKSNYEIQLIKKSIEIAKKSFLETLKLIKTNIREREVAIELEYRMMKNGADMPAFPTIVAYNSHSALPHAKPRDVKIGNKGVLLIDFGAVYKGYHSDITRTIILGDVNTKVKRIFDTVKEASDLAMSQLKVEVNGAEIAKSVDMFIKKSGFKEGLIHSLGHGVGLDIHEFPVLSENKDLRLMKNTVFTIEPGIYIEGLCGVRIENMVSLTDKGYINLTEYL